MIAGIAFAVGLVIGACVLLVPFALSGKGKHGEAKPTAVASTSGAAAPVSSPPQQAASKAEPAADATAAANAPSDAAATASDDASASCDRQAWPYTSQECRQKEAATRKDRQVRVVTTDAGAPATIETPAPVGSPKPPSKAQQPGQAAVPPPARTDQATAAPIPSWATQQPPAQAAIAPAAPAEPAPSQAPAVVATANAAEATPKAEPGNSEGGAKPAVIDRKPREAREKKSGRMMVRTIEFADGRKVTITRPIGKDGPAAAKEALDRAAEREMAKQAPEGRERAVADSDSDEPGPTLRARSEDVGRRQLRERVSVESDSDRAMGQADDDDLDRAPRFFRHRSR